MGTTKSKFSAKPARLVLAALQRIGWIIKRQRGSHRILSRPGWNDYVFAYHDQEEIGPVALKRIGQKTGLKPSDL